MALELVFEASRRFPLPKTSIVFLETYSNLVLKTWIFLLLDMLAVTLSFDISVDFEEANECLSLFCLLEFLEEAGYMSIY